MKFLFFIIVTIVCMRLDAQPSRYNAELLDTLAEIAATNAPSKHFAKLYREAIVATNIYADKLPDSVKHFIFGFESLFAPEFFQSHRNYVHQQPQVFAWQRYYMDSTLNELQYQYMGMNAHVNGDMWIALKDKYPYDSIKKYKPHLIRFQKILNRFFDSTYQTTYKYKKIKRLHFFTLGFDKSLGRRMLLHWRKRQIKLAMLWYKDPVKCEHILKKIKRKMLRFDRFALRAMK